MTLCLDHIFSFVCGQTPAHTWAPGGLALPFCQRCAGLYVGAVIGVLLQVLFRPRFSTAYQWMHGLFLLQMIPFGFHLVPQGPMIRTITGGLFGLGVVGYLWPLATACATYENGGEAVDGQNSSVHRILESLKPTGSRRSETGRGAHAARVLSSPARRRLPFLRDHGLAGARPSEMQAQRSLRFYSLCALLGTLLVPLLAKWGGPVAGAALAWIGTGGLFSLAILVSTNLIRMLLWLLEGFQRRLGSPAS